MAYLALKISTLISSLAAVPVAISTTFTLFAKAETPASVLLYAVARTCFLYEFFAKVNLTMPSAGTSMKVAVF